MLRTVFSEVFPQLPDPEYLSRRKRPPCPCGDECFLMLDSFESGNSDSEGSSRSSSPGPMKELRPRLIGLPISDSSRKRVAAAVVRSEDEACTSNWTGPEASLFNVFKPIFGHNYCALAKGIGTKTCKQVRTYFYDCVVSHGHDISWTIFTLALEITWLRQVPTYLSQCRPYCVFIYLYSVYTV